MQIIFGNRNNFKLFCKVKLILPNNEGVQRVFNFNLKRETYQFKTKWKEIRNLQNLLLKKSISN